MSKRLLVITAHADDAEFFAGGTLARFASEGYEIVEVITTDNGRGSFELDSASLVTQSRKVEARKAAEVIGKKDVVFLGYPDGFLGDTPLNVIREQYMKKIREFKPDVLFTFDPWAPFESHPDHRHVGMAAVEAAGFAHLPLFHPEHSKEGLQPHLTPYRYYFAKDGTYCNKVVDITGFVAQKIDSICAHESQVRMLVQDIRMSVEATGQYAGMLPLLDPGNYRPAIEMFIKAWASDVGESEGYEAGEEFRYEQVDDLLKIADRDE